MTNLAQLTKSQVARFPEVLAFVVADNSGALLEATGEIDGEAVAAVIAVAVRSLNGVGEQLGMGNLRRASLTGPGLACVLAPYERDVLAVYIDPSKPLAPFEKRLDGLIHRQGG